MDCGVYNGSTVRTRMTSLAHIWNNLLNLHIRLKFESYEKATGKDKFQVLRDISEVPYESINLYENFKLVVQDCTIFLH